MISTVLIEDTLTKTTVGPDAFVNGGTCADHGYTVKLGKDPLFKGAHIFKKPIVFLE